MIERGIEAGLFTQELKEFLQEQQRIAMMKIKKGEPVDIPALFKEIRKGIDSINDTFQNA